MLSYKHNIIRIIQTPSMVSMTPPLSIMAALQHAMQRLTDANETAWLDAEVLLSFAMHCPRSYLHTWPERLLNEDQAQLYSALIERRAAGEPVAYLTGHREFWSMPLAVTRDTLIPRPETELLVELALQRIPTDSAWRIADLGTGSGAIALAIARERSTCHVIATDHSAAALAVARCNAVTLGISNIEFRTGDWLAPLNGETLHVIISNPPYVSTLDPRLTQPDVQGCTRAVESRMPGTADIRFEPLSALASGIDGLDDIRRITETARYHLIAGGWLLLEHGYDQGAAVMQILRNHGYHDVSNTQDFAGLDRVVSGRWVP